MKKVIDWTYCILVGLAIVAVTKLFIFNIMIVQGESMYPMLRAGDRMFVNKLSSRILSGDIIVFRNHDGLQVKTVLAVPNQFYRGKINTRYTVGGIGANSESECKILPKEIIGKVIGVVYAPQKQPVYHNLKMPVFERDIPVILRGERIGTIVLSGRLSSDVDIFGVNGDYHNRFHGGDSVVIRNTDLKGNFDAWMMHIVTASDAWAKPAVFDTVSKITVVSLKPVYGAVNASDEFWLIRPIAGKAQKIDPWFQELKSGKCRLP